MLLLRTEHDWRLNCPSVWFTLQNWAETVKYILNPDHSPTVDYLVFSVLPLLPLVVSQNQSWKQKVLGTNTGDITKMWDQHADRKRCKLCYSRTAACTGCHERCAHKESFHYRAIHKGCLHDGGGRQWECRQWKGRVSAYADIRNVALSAGRKNWQRCTDKLCSSVWRYWLDAGTVCPW